ncbi:MAG: cupin domain-containing protein [Acidimicrobiales bacterium]
MFDGPLHKIQRRTLQTAKLFGTTVTAEQPSAGTHPETYTDYAFPVLGQGTISLTINATGAFRIVLNSVKHQSGEDRRVLVLEVGAGATRFRVCDDDDPASVIAETTDPEALVDAGVARTYWLSVDKNNRLLRFGKGEMLPALCLFECGLTESVHVSGEDPFAFVASLRYIGLVDVAEEDVTDHCLWAVPVTTVLPPSLVAPDVLTVEDIANEAHTVVAHLPSACQVLYGTVAGQAITLNTADFPDFSAAIDHSIDTAGCICSEKLKAKESEFGDPAETYLRVTIGPNEGDSPGSPYVVEIWPAGHYSPIHDHGKACAIIKVLHGLIQVELFPELSPEITEPFAVAMFEPGDVTYLTPQLYQVHRLQNPAGQGMTATIQCYRYADEDMAHYEYFDYIDKNDKIQVFAPNSDWEFLAFKKLIREEWANRT